jgi:hypothetical protein
LGEKVLADLGRFDHRVFNAWEHGGECRVEAALRRLTFELTPTTEAGGVSPVRENSTSAADRAYAACRSGSAVERGVRPHRGCPRVLMRLRVAPAASAESQGRLRRPGGRLPALAGSVRAK